VNIRTDLEVRAPLAPFGAPARQVAREAALPQPQDSVQLKAGPGRLETKEAVSAAIEPAAAPAPAPVAAGPQQAPMAAPPATLTPVSLLPSPVSSASPLAEAQGRFRAALSSHPQAALFDQAYTFAGTYSQDRVDLPFPYLASQDGRVELNDLTPLVKGLKALGAHETARGMLENWLSLGERYSALPGSNQLNELGRSGMPRLSSLLLEEAGTHPDPEFVERSYRVLEGDWRNNWQDRYFKLTPNGLNRFCDVDYSHDATLAEAGGAKNAARYDGDPMPYNPVDLNAYLWRTEKDLETLARQRGDEDAAAQWADRAATRKETLLKLTWNPTEKFFFDYDYRESKQSDVRCLGAYSLLTAGVLDPAVPAEKAMVEALVEALPSFGQPPAWDLKSGQPAGAADRLDLAEGLRRYGFPAQALGVDARFSQETTLAGVAAQAAARGGSAPGQQAWLSPQGAERLELLTGSREIANELAGRTDRRLHELHETMLEPALVADLKNRGLSEAVYWQQFPSVAGQEKEAFTVGTTPVELGGLRVKVSELGPGAVLLEANGQKLAVVESGDRVIVGDRAYARPAGALRIPQGILDSFYTAGGNPALEAFCDKNRSWLGEPAQGPASQAGKWESRPGWGRLFDKTGHGWKELTIEPSVVAKDTASQFFHRAAVPSLGIFKCQFNWDTLFMSKGMQLQGQQETVAGMADNLLYLLQDTGRVPNAARSVYLNKSQPPILPSLVRMAAPWREATRGPEAAQEWKKEAYSLLSKDYDFWNREGEGERGIPALNGEKVHLSRWGGSNHKFAMDESGLDTTSRLYGHTLDLVSPEPNCFLYQFAQDMKAIATELAASTGDSRYTLEAAQWEARAAERKADLIKYCWDEEAGMFRDYRFQGENQGLQREQDGIGNAVMPLWVGMLDPNDPKEREMAQRCLANLDRFERDHGLTSTAEDYGHPEMQWNAPSGWAPHHMMAIEGALKYGGYDQAARIVTKWLDTLDRVYSKDGQIIERYNMETGGHPPVQKGRYEETQGEGPGFGWTNATVPWGMVEIVGGLKSDGTTLRVEPCIPEALEGQDLALEYAEPNGKGKFAVTQRYEDGHYQAALKGDFFGPVEVLTPPLPAGMIPQVEGGEFTLRQEKCPDGQVRYRVLLESPSAAVAVAFQEPRR